VLAVYGKESRELLMGRGMSIFPLPLRATIATPFGLAFPSRALFIWFHGRQMLPALTN